MTTPHTTSMFVMSPDAYTLRQCTVQHASIAEVEARLRDLANAFLKRTLKYYKPEHVYLECWCHMSRKTYTLADAVVDVHNDNSFFKSEIQDMRINIHTGYTLEGWQSLVPYCSTVVNIPLEERKDLWTSKVWDLTLESQRVSLLNSWTKYFDNRMRTNAN